jgi:hypothetical protein
VTKSREQVKISKMETTNQSELKLSGPIDLIKKSLSLFFEKENFIYLVKIYAPLLPFQLFFVLQTYFVDSQSKVLNTTDLSLVYSTYIWLTVVVVVVNLLNIIIAFWVSLAGIIAVSGIVSGKKTTVKEVFASSWTRLRLFALLSVLVGLIEIGGGILLIIPGIIFGIWYGFSEFVFVVEGRGIKDSLKASKKLVVGRFWKVFGRVLVFGMFSVLFQVIFSLIPYGIGSIIFSVFGALFVIPYFFLYKELSG